MPRHARRFVVPRDAHYRIIRASDEVAQFLVVAAHRVRDGRDPTARLTAGCAAYITTVFAAHPVDETGSCTGRDCQPPRFRRPPPPCPINALMFFLTTPDPTTILWRPIRAAYGPGVSRSDATRWLAGEPLPPAPTTPTATGPRSDESLPPRTT